MTLLEDEGGGFSPPPAQAETNYTDWIDTVESPPFTVNLSVLSLTGTTPTLDWSIEHKKTPTGSPATLVASSAFTQVTDGTAFPNLQTKPIDISDDANACGRWIRVKWTLGGTTPVAAVVVEIKPTKQRVLVA